MVTPLIIGVNVNSVIHAVNRAIGEAGPSAKIPKPIVSWTKDSNGTEVKHVGICQSGFCCTIWELMGFDDVEYNVYTLRRYNNKEIRGDFLTSGVANSVPEAKRQVLKFLKKRLHIDEGPADKIPPGCLVIGDGQHLYRFMAHEFAGEGDYVRGDNESDAIDNWLDYAEKHWPGLIMTPEEVEEKEREGRLDDYICGGNHGVYLNSLNYRLVRHQGPFRKLKG